jgi:transposase-like protein
LQARSSRPHRLRSKAAPELDLEVVRLRRLRRPCWNIAAQTELSRATVARICKRKGLSRLSALEPKPPVIR